jgi:hypothetical protein
MNPRGIPIAQFASNLEADAKVRLLARRLEPMSYYAALGAYISIVLAAWANASRDPDAAVVELVPVDLLDALRSVGLLAEDGGITQPAFDRWVGSVLDARRKDADRKRGERSPTESNGVQRSPKESNEPSSPLLSSGDIEILSSGDDGGMQGGDDPVVAYYTLTTRYPRGNALAWCKRLGDTYGFGHASASMLSAWADSDDIGTLLSRTEDRLVASERAAELREKADEKERLRQKRTTKRVVVDPGPEKVGAIMDDIRKVLGR